MCIPCNPSSQSGQSLRVFVEPVLSARRAAGTAGTAWSIASTTASASATATRALAAVAATTTTTSVTTAAAATTITIAAAKISSAPGATFSHHVHTGAHGVGLSLGRGPGRAAALSIALTKMKWRLIVRGPAVRCAWLGRSLPLRPWASPAAATTTTFSMARPAVARATPVALG